MDKVTTIDFDNGKSYYFADDILKHARIYCRGCRNGRQIIEKRTILQKEYIYAREDDDSWNISDGSSKKFDKILISKRYVEKNVPEFSKDAKYDIEIAPPILELKKSEQFKDNLGNVIPIRVVGTRTAEGCFFPVSDVSAGFGLKNLYDTILGSHSRYENCTHYVFFNCKYITKKHDYNYRKRLFFTYLGFSKFIEVNRSLIHVNTIYTMRKWLELFKGNNLNGYMIHLPTDIEKYQGLTYTVTSRLLDAIKIGYWTSSIESLRSRYITAYGNDITLHCVTSRNARELESKTHTHFNKYRITNELFEKKYLKIYNVFLDDHEEIIDYNLPQNDNIIYNYIDEHDQYYELIIMEEKIKNIISKHKLKVNTLENKLDIREKNHKYEILQKDTEIAELKRQLRKHTK